MGLLKAVSDITAQEGLVFARQPCDRIPMTRDLGQWLCVPPFQVVCLCQVLTLCFLHVIGSGAREIASRPRALSH